MSHEIRTPMNAIVGMTEMLQGSPLNPEQKGWAETLQSSCDLLIQLINDILDLSKIEARQIRIETRPFDLRAVAGEAARIMVGVAHRKALPFHLQVSEELPHWLIGDSLRIKQILLNLLGNAVKFTERGAVTCDILQEGGRVLLREQDTGVGISDDMRLRMFEPFQQGDASTTRRFGGTGLGLAITHRLVGLMGGTITCKSKVGEGTVFEVYLPLPVASQPSEVSANEPRDGRVRSAMHLLLVEEC